MQEPHWGLGKFQEFAPSDRQQYMQRPMTNTVYAYQYGVQSGAHETPMPMYYEHDHHHHSAQHVNPMWAHQLQPYPAMSAEQVMSQMPMNVYGPTSIPQSPVAWPQSPQFWQSSHGPQHQSRHISLSPFQHHSGLATNSDASSYISSTRSSAQTNSKSTCTLGRQHSFSYTHIGSSWSFPDAGICQWCPEHCIHSIKQFRFHQFPFRRSLQIVHATS